MTAYTHRIRRCNGNTMAWLLVALRDDGKEMLAHGSFTTTAMTLDGLLKHAKGLLPDGEDVIQLLYFPEDKGQS